MSHQTRVPLGGPRTLTPKLKEVCDRLGIDVSGHKQPPPAVDYTALVDGDGHCQPSAVECYPAPSDDHARALRRRKVAALCDPLGDAFPPATVTAGAAGAACNVSGPGGCAAYLSPISHNSTFAESPSDPIPTDSAGKPIYWCQRSHFILAGPAENGQTRIIPAPCNANDCPYCGRVKMYRKRNRMYDSFAQHRADGALIDGQYLFITADLRPSMISHALAFKFIKPAMAYAFMQLRKVRTGKSTARGFKKRSRGGWPGVSIGYCNDIDLQPGTKMAHGHCIALCQPMTGHKLPCQKQIARELHHHMSNFLYRKMGLPKRTSYRRGASPCWVDVQAGKSEQNIANYMALHNQKIFEPWREYPRRYRRFSASKGFLVPLPEKPKSDWEFLPLSASFVAARAVATGRGVSDVESKGERVTGYTVAAPWGSDDTAKLLGLVRAEQQPVNIWHQRRLTKAYQDHAQFHGTDYYNGPERDVLDARQASLIGRTGLDADAYWEKVAGLEGQWSLTAQQAEAESLGLCWADYELWRQGRLGD